MKNRVVVIRLSSLGDVVLSTAAIEGLSKSYKNITWITSDAYVDFLKFDPRLNTVVGFKKKQGLKAWVQLLLSMATAEPETEFLDLHRSSRSLVGLWCVRMILRWRGQKVPVVRVVSKQRLKTFAVLLLKRWCPTSWKPTPWKNVYASLGGAAAALPKLYTSAKPSGANAPTQKSDYRIGIAPGSAKAAKEWPTASWISLCTELHAFGASLVVLGLSQEPAVRALKKSLLEKKIPFEDHSQNLSPQHTLQSVGSLKRLIGVDSGLAHVAEALGVPSTVLFGPTHPDLGFGPHLPQSQTVCAGLSCQPCGKTSFPCHRRPKYLCQSSMSSDSVFKLLMSQESGQGQ